MKRGIGFHADADVLCVLPFRRFVVTTLRRRCRRAIGVAKDAYRPTKGRLGDSRFI